MDQTEIETTVFAILQKISQSAIAVGPQVKLREELGMDSFASLMVMNELDDAFGIEIFEEDFLKVTLAADVVRLLQERYLVSATKSVFEQDTAGPENGNCA